MRHISPRGRTPWALALLLTAGAAHAAIGGVAGPHFELIAREGFVLTPDGNSIHAWGYGVAGGDMQYPGPTLIVNQGDTVTLRLVNELPVPVSLVFPGQEGVAATGGVPGLLAREARPGEAVSYTFQAREPGTYLYHSGSRPELQVEMGLVGALIVRPATPGRAYPHPATAFDHEYLFLLTEMDPRIHEQVEQGRMDLVDLTDYRPVYWFINGRAAPDTMAPAGAPWLPNQPYDCMPMMHPGEQILLRLIGAGRDPHPFHTHGNHAAVIARDARLLESSPGAGPNLAREHFTVTVTPGQTTDALFRWTGEKLGWDIYGHATGGALQPNEYAPDHGKPLPVALPHTYELTAGDFYGGTPFLGVLGPLPPGQGTLNLEGGFFFMWHSHAEREMVNNDVFPGGMMTMLLIVPHGVEIP